MNTLAASPCQAAAPPLSGLGAALLEHLRLEADALRETGEVLDRMRDALLGADLDLLRDAERQQERIAAHLEQLRDARLDLVNDLASAAGVPLGELTARAVAARLPAHLSERLDRAREELSLLAQRVASSNRANAALALHGITFVRGCLAGLYGEAAGRYGRAGMHPEPRRGAILLAQG